MEVDTYEMKQIKRDDDVFLEIFSREQVKEEPSNIETFSKYEVCNKSHLEQNQDTKLYMFDSTEFEEPSTSHVRGSEEPKPSLTHCWDSFDKEIKPKLDPFHRGEVIIKNETDYQCEYATNISKLKTKAHKTEDEIDIIYQDIKPEIGWETSLQSINEIEPGAGLLNEDGKDSRRQRDNHSKEKTVSCEFCSKPFSRKCNMMLHVRTHTGEKPFHCDICSRSFSHRSNLVRHKKTHTGEKPFHCKVCSESFQKKSVLMGHMTTHTGENPFKCNFCLKSFALKENLLKHRRVHKGEEPCQCKVCTKYSRNSDFLVHLGEKPFVCKLCSKSFTRKCQLLAHERIHTGENIHCEICEKSFNLKINLIGHMRTHTGERPFKCDLCSKSFALRSNLLGHQRTHTGEKPFHCKFCTKSFTKKTNLLVHERLHTGEKPFQCDLCSDSFSRNNKLLVHKKIHKVK